MRADKRREEFAAHFAVSRMTIHRHIDVLAGQGMLCKLHDVVTMQPSSLYESTFRYRETLNNVLFLSASAIDGTTAFLQDEQVTKVK